MRSGLVACLALALNACGGGGGDGNKTPVVSNANTPAAGVYLDTAAPSTQLRPSFVAAVSHAPAGTLAGWTAWQAIATVSGGDNQMYLGTTDVSAAASDALYFDTNGRQSGSADLRNSLSTQLRGVVSMAASQPLSLAATQLAPGRLLDLAALSGAPWQGDWRHGSGVSVDKLLSFSMPAGNASQRVFLTQSILGCYVDATVTEQVSGSPGLFKVVLSLSQISGSTCSRVGSYQGVLVAYLDAANNRQLRLAATDAAQQLAISYVARAVPL